MSLTVAKDRVVQIHYVLTDDKGEMLDASASRPLSYLHGHDNIIKGLESALEGKATGDEFEVVLQPADAYGEYKPDAVQSVHRRDLPKETRIEPGAPIRAEGSDGKPVMLWVTKVQGARVTITTNHPLAGKTLHFRGMVASVREAAPDEIEHGHAHEPGHTH